MNCNVPTDICFSFEGFCARGGKTDEHLFAHNGNLENFSPAAGDFYQPVGETDSEKAFCLILNTLRETFPQGKPSLEQLYPVLKTITNSIACQGIFNYLLCDGEHFFAHCSTKLSYIIRQYPFAAAHLIDEDVSVDFQALARLGDQVAIIATTPLTDNEVWTAINAGELLVFQEGAAILS